MRTEPPGRGPGPRRSALIALMAAAIVMLATGASVPKLTGGVTGEAQVGGNATFERDVRIHVEPDGGHDASGGTVTVALQAGSGLDHGYSNDVAVSIVGVADADGPVPTGPAIPVERCQSGCDLVYRLAITTGPTVLPGSVVRYDVAVEITYDSSFGERDPSLMTVDVDGRVTGPVPAIWALVLGLLATVVGLRLAPALAARLPPARRRWPALALAALPVVLLGWMTVQRLVALGDVPDFLTTVSVPSLLLYLVDPWSTILLATLSWGMVRGLRHWPMDGGWLLGLAAVALTGLGGLFLTWIMTLDPVVQPVIMGVGALALGGLAGFVIGQAWRTDARAFHDRWWAGSAVVAHGVLIAGFGFLAEESFQDPFATVPSSLLSLIPAALLTWAFRRWFRGRRAWLALFDILILAIGVLGVWIWFSPSGYFGAGGPGFQIDDLAILIAVAAAAIASVTAFHSLSPVLSSEAPPAPPASPDPTQRPGPPVLTDAERATMW